MGLHQLIGLKNEELTKYWPDTFPQMYYGLKYQLIHIFIN